LARKENAKLFSPKLPDSNGLLRDIKGSILLAALRSIHQLKVDGVYCYYSSFWKRKSWGTMFRAITNIREVF